MMNLDHVGGTDLNLLVALDVLLEERSVTRAADRLGLTQSATSRVLGRLRRALGDPLFVRTSVITRVSAKELKLKKGDAVTVVIKSTEVMLQKN